MLNPTGARAILDAASVLFAKGGFDSVSMAEIASHAGVSKANIFHHFASKEALYLAVMREASTNHAEFTEGLLDLDVSTAEKLRKLVRYDFDYMFSHQQHCCLVFREVLNTGSSQGRVLAEQVFQRNFAAVVALFRQGQSRGEIRAELDPAVAAWMVGAAVMMFFQNRETMQRMPKPNRVQAPENCAEQIVDVLIHGFETMQARAAASRIPAKRAPVRASKPTPKPVSQPVSKRVPEKQGKQAKPETRSASKPISSARRSTSEKAEVRGGRAAGNRSGRTAES